ncbi:N-formylglutamate deformylase [Sneathiella limimaris]|uniref:N-formylglutamate deformylase n=1 Tax=Sneathiella limimaris TaxID=1964213 RepID=UPI00146A046C|nr:N-formylglutamate deformylase [Sneathiella limimaris]
MKPVTVRSGKSPIVLAFPHVGTHVPDQIFNQLSAVGKKLSDTDWHVDRLYDGLLPEATMVVAGFHRYVIDANRDPSGVSLYPGQNTTTLVPTTDFDGQPIWQEGHEPTKSDIEERRVAFHAPYHKALAAEINRVKELHGFAVLYDCHSIRSEIAYLFDGKLPDFNIGTNGGTTCAPELEAHVLSTCAAATDYSHVLNGRFKGGWTTRHYANPAEDVHVIQMELAQSTYCMETDPWDYIDVKAEKLRPVLKSILVGLEDIAIRKLGPSRTKSR